MRHFLIFIFFTFFSITLFGQENSIKVLAQYKDKKVTLRWAPSNPYVWQLGNKYGFVIERFSLLTNGKLNDIDSKVAKPLSSHPIKPYSKEAFEPIILKDEKAGVVQECLYGESFQISDNPTPEDLLRNKQELENKFGMALLVCDMSQITAIAAGLLWFDKRLEKGARYAYRISLAPNPSGIKVEPGVAVLDIGKERVLPIITDVKVKFDDQKAVLTWPVFLHNRLYSAYFVERSTDGKTFKNLNDLPYIMMGRSNDKEYSYVDSLPDNEKTYYYRVKGMSAFAESSPPSKAISGKGRKGLEGVVTIMSASVIQNSKVTLTWSVQKDYEPLIKGFYITRSSNSNGPYVALNKDLLPLSQRTFIDTPPSYNNYYQIKYIHKTSGEAYFSFPFLAQLVDSIPPVAPVGIKAKVDSLGIVRLEWKPNAEIDILGYRVFRANSLKEEFIERTTSILPIPTFIDTVNIHTLTKNAYYQIIAVDKYYNPSHYSTILAIARPDIIAPNSPAFTSVITESNGVKLEWVNSSSNDVLGYELWRKAIGKDSIKLADWKGTRTLFRDSTTTLGIRYRYYLVAIDSTGNSGIAKSKEVLFETGARMPIREITATVDRANKKIMLKWEYSQTSVSKFTIYRGKEGQPLKIYKVLPGNILTYQDTDAEMNSVYHYNVQASFKNGIRSELSQPIKVRY
ncbi:MAG TPA: hypothetical protein VF691_12275 [Cytophagaceae bacterium]|jgi:fibronectin type 3 domain-containing protein